MSMMCRSRRVSAVRRGWVICYFSNSSARKITLAAGPVKGVPAGCTAHVPRGRDLSHQLPAVDVDRVPDDVAGGRRDEERDRRGAFGRRTDTPERDRRDEALD